jgi:hypothetical protein
MPLQQSSIRPSGNDIQTRNAQCCVFLGVHKLACAFRMLNLDELHPEAAASCRTPKASGLLQAALTSPGFNSPLLVGFSEVQNLRMSTLL